MKNVIEKFKQVIIQIATPYSTGTGFYWKKADMIVTNEHVVRGNRDVLIEGDLFDRQLSKVLFTDPLYDLAFMTAPKAADLPAVALFTGEIQAEGEQVVAVGHPFGLPFSAIEGKVSGTRKEDNKVSYYQHDAALNPGNSGGPVINTAGEIIGVNTFMINDSDHIGFCLPSGYLQSTLDAFLAARDGETGTRCIKCESLVFDNTVKGRRCPHCGSAVMLPGQEEEYEPAGVSRTIEEILQECGHDIRLARRGPNSWEVRQGSAQIFVSYYEPNGLIAGDAVLCELPRKNIQPVYEYLLRQNQEIEGLTLSIRDGEIVLSLIIYDRYLNIDTGLALFKGLFQKADHYDDILVEKFNCSWKDVN